ncbi:MAG: InlB B-repeat-containing protein [Bacilli bacterium]|nr:InlB B-repeat-containing protein [Bacilli bacterium]
MNNRRIGLILLLLLLTVGFATVTTNLIINNTSNISTKPDDFSVIFKSANTEEDSSATISEDKKIITYETKELINPGDKSELTYVIKNNSSQYDADINLSTMLDSSISDLLSITYETIDNINTVNLPAKAEISGKIKIELIKSAIENMEVTLTVTFDANAVERSSIAYDNYTVRFNGNGAEEGSMDEQVMEYDMNTSLLSNQFTRSGYQMVGWTTNPNTNEDFYQDEQEVSKLTTGVTTIDLYAVWMKTDYDYTGGVQSLNIPATGTYKLEVWGAQGGDATSSYKGGYGGYSTGTISLNRNDSLYIVIGGAGVKPTARSCSVAGGYNGGGVSSVCEGSYGINTVNAGSGGGATHISTSNLGALKNYASDYTSLLIVAGAGGGADYSNFASNNYYLSYGGHGGGYIGGTSSGSSLYQGVNHTYTTGGTQTQGSQVNQGQKGLPASIGTFGQGGNATGPTSAGAGGGFYGGNAGKNWAGGGGSGYIANSLLDEKHMSCYNCTISNEINTKTISNTCSNNQPIADCSKQGHGYARITFIG